MILLLLSGIIFLLGVLISAIVGRIIGKLSNKAFKVVAALALLALLVTVPLYLYLQGLRVSFEHREKTITFKIFFTELEKIIGGQDVAFNPELIQEKPEDITTEGEKFHSSFDEEGWIGWEGFAKSLNNPKILMSRGKWPFDNPNLWFQKIKPTPVFDFTLKATPQNNDKGNMVLAYGQIWRCIIAESNYNTVTCETKYASRDKLRHLKTLSSLDKLPIKPKTELIIEGSTVIVEQNKLKLELLIKYVDSAGNKQEAPFVFKFDYPSPEPETNREYIGVGLIDSNEEGIAVEFSEFTLTIKQ